MAEVFKTTEIHITRNVHPVEQNVQTFELPKNMRPQTVNPFVDPRSQGFGTVQATLNFDPNLDADILQKVLAGRCADVQPLIDILCNRSAYQRVQIGQAYKTKFGRDLIKDLASETSGKFENLITALMYLPAEYDAYELHHAMSGLGTDESTLIEILASRTPAEIREINGTYLLMYGKELMKDIEGDTSRKFKHLLVALSTGRRNESYNIDPALAIKQAQDLHTAGVKKWTTEDAVFNAILCGENYAQLGAVFMEYLKLTGHDIEDAINKEFSGDVRSGLLAIVKVVKNKYAYFAERLHYTTSIFGTKDRVLTRVIVSRSEKDLAQIKQAFQIMYGETLEKFINDNTKDKYRDALLALVTGNTVYGREHID